MAGSGVWAEEEAGEDVADDLVVDDFVERGSDEVLEVGIGLPDLCAQFGATVDQGDDVVEVFADGGVGFATGVVGIEFGGEHERSGGDADAETVGKQEELGCGEGLPVPAVGEAEDSFFRAHEVDNELRFDEAADRARDVVGEAEGEEFVYRRLVSGVGGGGSENVDIQGGADIQNGRIGDV